MLQSLAFDSYGFIKSRLLKCKTKSLALRHFVFTIQMRFDAYKMISAPMTYDLNTLLVQINN